jgi:hypothetical protein
LGQPYVREVPPSGVSKSLSLLIESKVKLLGWAMFLYKCVKIIIIVRKLSASSRMHITRLSLARLQVVLTSLVLAMYCMYMYMYICYDMLVVGHLHLLY